MEYRLCCLIAIAVVLGILAAIVYFGFLVLTKFTGGKLLKLEDVDEKLADRLDEWMPLPDACHGAARLWVLVLWGAYAAVIGAIVVYQQTVADKWCWGGGAFVAWMLIVCIVEAIAPRLSLRSSALSLCFYIPLFRLLSWLSFPFVWLPVISTEHAKEKAVEQGEEDVNISTAEDEILSLINKSDDDADEESGIEDDERRMISGALALDDKTVHEIMTPRVDVDAVELHASLADIKALIVTSGHSRIPVYEGTIDKIKGIISAKDLLNTEKITEAEQKGLEALCREPLFVPETKNIGDLLAEFQAKKTHFAVVIDEYGGTSGIVTFEDILEEVVGDIWDEYDVPEAEVVPDADNDGWFIFDARTPISEVNEKLETDIPENEDYDTLGGYLASEAGHIPQEKEQVVTPSVEAEILSAEPRLVKKVRARRSEQPEGEAKNDG